MSLLAVVCLTRQGALQCACIKLLPQLFITVSQGLSCYSGIPGPRTQDYTKQVEPRPTQNPNLVYKAKSYSNTTTDPENVQPLNGKQQGVLDVEGAASPVRPLSCTFYAYSWQMFVRKLAVYHYHQPLNGKQQGVLDVEGAASPGFCSCRQ